MSLEIEYFHERVLAEVESWPADVVADYARLNFFSNTAQACAYLTPVLSATGYLNCGLAVVPA